MACSAFTPDALDPDAFTRPVAIVALPGESSLEEARFSTMSLIEALGGQAKSSSPEGWFPELAASTCGDSASEEDEAAAEWLSRFALEGGEAAATSLDRTLRGKMMSRFPQRNDTHHFHQLLSGMLL